MLNDVDGCVLYHLFIFSYMTLQEKSQTISAADRFFRAYHSHCISPNKDTLFNLLNSLHSLNDRLVKEFNENFFSFEEFIALKTLRNLFHHENELLSEVRVLPVKDIPISTDLLYLCVVPRNLVDKAISKIDNKWKITNEPLVRRAFKWYGNVVNINPCIFNCAVHVFEKSEKLHLLLKSEEYHFFRESYDFETQKGYDHFITGDISCHSPNINVLIQKVFYDIA